MKIYILDGAGSHNRTSGIIDKTAERLYEKTGVRAEWINYSASMLNKVGGNATWDESSREGVRMLLEEMSTHDEDVILLSYSAGNKPLHEFLNMYPELHDRILAAGFMSDPWRPKDRFQHGAPKPVGYGIKGEDYGPIPEKSYWTSSVNDVISAAWPDALMRYVADTVDGRWDEMITKAIELGRLGNSQLAWQIGIIRRQPLTWFFGLGGRIVQFGKDAHGYLTGEHTNAYINELRTPDGKRESLAVRLADTIVWKLKTDGTIK